MNVRGMFHKSYQQGRKIDDFSLIFENVSTLKI